MRAALTVWEGRVSPVFDVCREAVILTIEHGTVASRSRHSIATSSPTLKIARLVELGVDTLICGAITETMRQALVDQGVTVVGFVAGEFEEVEASFLAGVLPNAKLSMPGCSGNRERLRMRRRNGQGKSWGRNHGQ